MSIFKMFANCGRSMFSNTLVEVSCCVADITRITQVYRKPPILVGFRYTCVNRVMSKHKCTGSQPWNTSVPEWNEVYRNETQVYRKPTNTCLLLHFASHTDKRYKEGLLKTMIYRAHALYVLYHGSFWSRVCSTAFYFCRAGLFHWARWFDYPKGCS